MPTVIRELTDSGVEKGHAVPCFLIGSGDSKTKSLLNNGSIVCCALTLASSFQMCLWHNS